MVDAVLGGLAAGAAGAAATKLLGSKKTKTAAQDTSFSRKGTTTTDVKAGRLTDIDPEGQTAFNKGVQGSNLLQERGLATNPNLEVTRNAAGPSALQGQAFESGTGIVNRATDSLDPATSFLNSVVQGGIDPNSIPGFAELLKSQRNDLQRSGDRTARDIKLRSSGFGAAGSPQEAFALMENASRTRGDISRGQAEMTSPIAQMLLQRQLAAAGMAPEMAAAFSNSINQQANLGGMQRGIEQEGLNADSMNQQFGVDQFLQGLQGQQQAFQNTINLPQDTVVTEDISGHGFQSGGQTNTTDPNAAIRTAMLLGGGAANFTKGFDSGGDGLSALKNFLMPGSSSTGSAGLGGPPAGMVDFT